MFTGCCSRSVPSNHGAGKKILELAVGNDIEYKVSQEQGSIELNGALILSVIMHHSDYQDRTTAKQESDLLSARK